MSKISMGNFFKDFSIGQRVVHPLPRTVDGEDVSLYTAFTGSRFVLHSSDLVAEEMGYNKRPLDDTLMFHLTSGKSVRDISLNAVADLGHAETAFPNPVYVGDTVSMTSTVTGLKENSNGKSGVVYAHSIGVNRSGAIVLDFRRWVMVHKKDHTNLNGVNEVPTFAKTAPISRISVPTIKCVDTGSAGGKYFFEDYEIGERPDHPEGITVGSSDHIFATKLYQNNAEVRFNSHMIKNTPMGQRLMYGGIIISMTGAISFNGLQNVQWACAINSGAHANPTYAGDTIYTYTETLKKIEVNRRDIGSLRVRTIGLKDQTPKETPTPKGEDDRYLPSVVLDLDYTVVIPKKITEKE